MELGRIFFRLHVEFNMLCRVDLAIKALFILEDHE
jgi:hypothetical protein